MRGPRHRRPLRRLRRRRHSRRRSRRRPSRPLLRRPLPGRRRPWLPLRAPHSPLALRRQPSSPRSQLRPPPAAGLLRRRRTLSRSRSSARCRPLGPEADSCRRAAAALLLSAALRQRETWLGRPLRPPSRLRPRHLPLLRRRERPLRLLPQPGRRWVGVLPLLRLRLLSAPSRRQALRLRQLRPARVPLPQGPTQGWRPSRRRCLRPRPARAPATGRFRQPTPPGWGADHCRPRGLLRPPLPRQRRL